MRFSGHETFAVREGWLHKGLTLLEEDPSLFSDEHCADRLGVGSNMAKSIRHWLLATELARSSATHRRQHSLPLEATALAQLIMQRDPYFIDPTTWWVLHVNLVNSADHATSWWWFFNHFQLPRFERPVCVEALRRYLELKRRRLPSLRTLQSDIACLLASYAQVVPAEPADPEEARECPFLQLDLVKYFRGSGYFRISHEPKDIAPELLGYAVAKASLSTADQERRTEIAVREAAHAIGGPGRAFALGPESLFEVLLRSEKTIPKELQVVGLAGEQVIRVANRAPVEWLAAYYDRVEEADRHVA